MFADLHLHSRFSDGTFTPEEVAARGHRMGLAAMALTDHDTVEGCEAMQSACQKLGIEFATGTELTAEHEGAEVHLLGYFIDIHNPALLERMKQFQEVRHHRITEMVSRINNLGIPLRVEDVFELANCRSPGRPHMARALVQGEFCASMDEAFERFLKKNKPAYVPKFKISALDAMELIHQSGGLAVMAHPGLSGAENLIPKLAGCGLDGIECFHSKHTPSMSARFIQTASQYGLLITGGSDCHGNSKGKPLIGKVKVPIAYWKKMKEFQDTRMQSKISIQTPVAEPGCAKN